MKTDLVLDVQNLTKIYPPTRKIKKPFTAVNNVSFTIRRGEILGLLGPNGAGKTTTIQMLLGTLTPTSGSIVGFGKNFATHYSDVMQKIGFASTYINFPANLSIHENLIVHGMLYGLSGAKLQENIDKYLKAFRSLEFKKREFGSLSAGQKTRVMLAKAFMTEPELALLDEPTASLDPDIAHEVREFILREQKNRAISLLFTSHNMDEVATVCERVLVLQSGKVIASDTPDRLAASISCAHLELVITDGLKRLKGLTDEKKLTMVIKDRWVQVEIPEHDIAQFLTSINSLGIEFSHIAIEKPSLEDYFLQVARKGVAS